MGCYELSTLSWKLEGWRPFWWKLARAAGSVPEVGPFDAPVPGSVQEALYRAGVLPDWNAGVNSRACEWVEHRHWIYETVIPSGWAGEGESACLVAEGLDYSGWVLVDGEEAFRFEGALVMHPFDLGTRLGDQKEHTLALVFEEPPREQGQIGYTSWSKYFKPRYTYSWDWTPRVVPIGIWDRLTLAAGTACEVRLGRVQCFLGEDLCTGAVKVHVECAKVSKVRISLCDGGSELAAKEEVCQEGTSHITLDGAPVEAWWPNGAGAQKTYTVCLEIVGEDGKVCWQEEKTVGFKRVEWQACEGAPAGAEPWMCVVNGKPLFLQGVNWVPPRTCYHDSTEEEYERLITLYREMGCTVFRVWGGGILEKEIFYRLCDQYGILVWQEFPMSSSGVENYPPMAPEAIASLSRIARSYIERRAHHVSLLMWCGGNELTERTPEGAPVSYDHPCIAALKAVVEAEDPEHRFIATSPSGPQFYAHARNYGKGIHHDIHGPWGMGAFSGGGFKDLEAWRGYWEADDSLFRSEVGMPGASPKEIFERFGGGLPVFPPEGEYWQHTSGWWTQWDRFKRLVRPLKGDAGLCAYIELTQKQQAEAYAIAASACKERFPRCGGFIIWMGHDCFPCPANNSVIDFLRAPKPAYYALQAVFTRPVNKELG